MAGTLYVVATPIGNLEDITARALRVLREASVIAAEDTRRTSRLLHRYAIPTPTTSLHEHNEHDKTRVLIERMRAGDSVALVSDAGTPTVADPGRILIAAAVDAGLRVEPIPGPNAAVAALSVSAIPAEAFSFLGFPPTRSKDRKMWLERLARSGPVAVFYEAPHRIRQTLEDVARTLGDVSILLARELTKTHEELVRGPIISILSALREPKGEFTVVVNVGEKTEKSGDLDTTGQPGVDLSAEFFHMTKNGGFTRRQAISALARRHGQSARSIYAELERAKKSGG